MTDESTYDGEREPYFDGARRYQQGYGEEQLVACAECGHLHYDAVDGEYDLCPVEGCNCRGQDEHGKPRHACDPRPVSDGGDMQYEGMYGAPGYGHAWKCVVCGDGWSGNQGSLVPAEWMTHVMEPWEVE